MSETTSEICHSDIVIVGGGFSGIMVSLQIARRAHAPLSIAVIERRPAVGRGVAYVAGRRAALLNVPAGAMGAFPDEPDGFLRWLAQTAGDSVEPIDPLAYVARERYGAYLEALARDAQAAGARISFVNADIVDVERGGAATALIASDGRRVATGGQVVFALGGPPPADVVDDPGEVRDDPRYVRDPWQFLERGEFAADGDVVIVGSGLTALDVIAAFGASTRDNRLVVISRGGRFPQPHGSAPQPPIDPLPAGAAPTTTAELVRLVRAAIARAQAAGSDWRAVIDGLRPHVQVLWTRLPLAERRRFLRHVRALYDPHRHRAPASIIAVKDRLIAEGRLRLIAGRITAISAAPSGLTIAHRLRGGDVAEPLRAAQIINCAGPGNSYATSPDPLVRALLRTGSAVPDPSGLGLRAEPCGRLIAADGSAQPDLYTIGWPMRGALLETTAVRELRTQARILADELIASASPRAALADEVVSSA